MFKKAPKSNQNQVENWNGVNHQKKGPSWDSPVKYRALPAGKRQSLWHGVATTQVENCIFMADLPKSEGHDNTLPTSKEGFPGSSAGKEATCNAGDLSSIPG